MESNLGLSSRRPKFLAGIKFWNGIPFYLLIALMGVVVILQPNALSYTGFTLLLSASVPLAFAATAQMFIMAAGDIDLGIGTFVGLVNVITAIVLIHHIFFGLLIYLVLIAGYVLIGLLVHHRQLPSIVVTLGASFIWLGIAIMILPSPSGEVPSYIVNFFGWAPPFIPGPVIFLVAIGVIANLILMRTRYGAVLRGSGSNAEAIGRAGWSVAGTKATLFGFAGIFAVLSGLALSANTTSGDANNGSSYVLLSIVAVIIGGGEFSGGLVAPAGAVAGAVVVVLIGTVLTFLNVSSDYQIGAQGLILILTLGIRAVRNWTHEGVKSR
jgi:ribose/xylose/arabinose/galactoside ABC-type transport system permease subunit